MWSSGQLLAYTVIKLSPANLALLNHGTFAANVAAEEDLGGKVQRAREMAF